MSGLPPSIDLPLLLARIGAQTFALFEIRELAAAATATARRGDTEITRR